MSYINSEILSFLSTCVDKNNPSSILQCVTFNYEENHIFSTDTKILFLVHQKLSSLGSKTLYAHANNIAMIANLDKDVFKDVSFKKENILLGDSLSFGLNNIKHTQSSVPAYDIIQSGLVIHPHPVNSSEELSFEIHKAGVIYEDSFLHKIRTTITLNNYELFLHIKDNYSPIIIEGRKDGSIVFQYAMMPLIIS